MTRILTRDDVASVLELSDCIDAVERAFRDSAPAKSLGLHAAHGTFHVKAAIGDVFAAKINANFPSNPREQHLPTIQGVIVLMDVERGTPLAILDSTLITTLRTAAATAVAVKYLAREDARVATIIGYGTLGRATAAALPLVRSLQTIHTFDLGEDFDEAVAASEIVVTCTPSRTPLLHHRHLHPGLFIAAVGADNPEKQELAPEVLAASRVVADVLEQAATMGDLHHAIAAGVMRREDVHAELGDVIGGRAPARRNRDEIFVFDSTGTALQDVAVASIAFRRASERGIGLELAFA